MKYPWQRTWCGKSRSQARNQLGRPRGAKSFLRRAQFLKTTSNSFKVCPTHSSSWRNIPHGGLAFPAHPLVTVLVAAAYIAGTICFSFISPYKATFDCLYKLLPVVVTLPVTSASCEKRFSKIKFVKTFPRNSMTSERLSSDALLSIEKVRADKIYLDNFIDKFDSRHDRIKLY